MANFTSLRRACIHPHRGLLYIAKFIFFVIVKFRHFARDCSFAPLVTFTISYQTLQTVQ